MSDFLANFVDAAPASKTKVSPIQTQQKFYKKDDILVIPFKFRGAQDEEISIERMKKSMMTFLNKSVIFYGPGGTGKTTLMKNYMYLMKPLFPIVFVFCPTNFEKHDWEGIIPTPLIFENFGVDEIRQVYLRQRMAASIYSVANNLKTLHSLFERVANPRAKQFLRKLIILRQKSCTHVEHNVEDPAVRKAKLKDIDELFNNKLILFYKQVIYPHIRRLSNHPLTENAAACSVPAGGMAFQGAGLGAPK